MSIVDVEPLIIRQSPKRLLSTAGIMACIICGYVLLAVAGLIEAWLLWFGVVVFGAMLVLGLIQALRARTAQWELRLDDDGVTVRDRPTVPWSDIAEVRVRSLFPRWVPLVMRSSYVVAFGGQPGVVMPSLPSARMGPLSRRGERSRERRFGTRLVVPPKTFDASTDVMLEAVGRFSDLPVIRE